MGAYRIADRLDFQAARQDPKLLIGFSENTVLHLALWWACQLAGIHDPDSGMVYVREAFTRQQGKGMVLGPPKSRASVRAIAFPAAVLPIVQTHLDQYVDEGAEAFVFTTANGHTIWRSNFNTLTAWKSSVAKLGVAGLHFYDLRHTGNTLAEDRGQSAGPDDSDGARQPAGRADLPAREQRCRASHQQGPGGGAGTPE